jgi:hypothetical protein
MHLACRLVHSIQDIGITTPEDLDPLLLENPHEFVIRAIMGSRDYHIMQLDTSSQPFYLAKDHRLTKDRRENLSWQSC